MLIFTTDYQDMPWRKPPWKSSRMSKSAGSSTKRFIQLFGNKTKDFPPILFPQRRGTLGDLVPCEDRTNGTTTSQKVFREYIQSKIRRRSANYPNVLCGRWRGGIWSTDVPGEKCWILAGWSRESDAQYH